ncbi:Trp biosynthesis-associated membrane protein [Pseudofrankia sp. DC12]|uniref:Trp biosynthesis-associated membrane protein n=1 Tax=Pseudofrankia sp. DC12 TaxID=683315 RepID=UPI0005F7768F|nr:Trp biosynthesis-associated membrane protein [Pseudofrankia sp. DC12]
MSADTGQIASSGLAAEAATPARADRPGHRLAGRTGLGVAVGGCLLGAAVALLAASATWVHTDVRDAATAGSGASTAPLAVKLGAGDLAPAVSAFGLLGLATAVALVATRGVARRVVGALVAAAGVGVIVYAARVSLDPAPVVRAAQHVVALAPSGHPSLGPIEVSAAPWLALVGGVALLGAGLLAAAFGRSWPAMGGRYQTRSPRPLDAWEAIERGQDPTVSAD